MILAGDIGGTNARLTCYRQDGPNFVVVRESVYRSRDYRGLDEIVAKFISDTGVRPEVACFGIAGPVRHDRVEASNLPWIVEAAPLAAQLHLDSVSLINDLEAQGWGIRCLGESDTVSLNKTAGASVGNQAVVAAGTGLGEAGLFWDGQRHLVFACEGGHSDFAPHNELEVELFRYLQVRFAHVSYERIVSGPGLVNVFMFLRDTHRGEQPAWLSDEMRAGDPAAAISRAAIAGKSALAEHALDLWVSVYGAEAGNMALKVLATGGVYLAGGIAPKVLPRLTGPLFMQAFLGKGRMQPLMETIPVRLITNEKTGLLGAARYASNKKSTVKLASSPVG